MDLLLNNLCNNSNAIGWALVRFLWHGILSFLTFWMIISLFSNNEVYLKYWISLTFIKKFTPYFVIFWILSVVIIKSSKEPSTELPTCLTRKINEAVKTLRLKFYNIISIIKKNSGPVRFTLKQWQFYLVLIFKQMNPLLLMRLSLT